MNAVMLVILALLICAIYAKDEPQLVGSGGNVTVVEGRDATLTCRVLNLQNYKVAWLRVDTQTILTIGIHVITKNHRVSVTRGDSQTWTLTLRDVRFSDGGVYMCQINTEPMITQTYNLEIFVPPDIVDSGSSSEVMVREGDNVSLHCAASGTPSPTITWRREDAAGMTVEFKNVSKWSGEWLNMSDVRREMNGAFLCIATNGVPPSVSKRILLHVLCKPSVQATYKMMGGYLGDAVVLRCYIEANPMPTVYWTHIDSRLQNGSKYQVSIKSEGYKHAASLRVWNVSREDIGAYLCHADNALGSGKDDITMYTLVPTSTTTATETTDVESTTEESVITSSSAYEELELVEEGSEQFSEDNYVVVLSQHQMQNLELPASS